MISEVDYKRAVCDRLMQAIEALGLTQAEVAREFGVSASRLGHWTKGLHYPDQFFIYRFCRRYNVSADWIYRGMIVSAMAKPLADALWEVEQASSQAQEAVSAPAPKKPRLSKKPKKATFAYLRMMKSGTRSC